MNCCALEEVEPCSELQEPAGFVSSTYLFSLKITSLQGQLFISNHTLDDCFISFLGCSCLTLSTKLGSLVLGAFYCLCPGFWLVKDKECRFAMNSFLILNVGKQCTNCSSSILKGNSTKYYSSREIELSHWYNEHKGSWSTMRLISGIGKNKVMNSFTVLLTTLEQWNDQCGLKMMQLTQGKSDQRTEQHWIDYNVYPTQNICIKIGTIGIKRRLAKKNTMNWVHR